MPRYTGSNVCSKPVALLPTLASIMVRVFSDRNPVVAEVRLPPPVAPDNWKSIRILVWKKRVIFISFFSTEWMWNLVCFFHVWKTQWLWFPTKGMAGCNGMQPRLNLALVIQIQCFFFQVNLTKPRGWVQLGYTQTLFGEHPWLWTNLYHMRNVLLNPFCKIFLLGQRTSSLVMAA